MAPLKPVLSGEQMWRWSPVGGVTKKAESEARDPRAPNWLYAELRRVVSGPCHHDDTEFKDLGQRPINSVAARGPRLKGPSIAPIPRDLGQST